MTSPIDWTKINALSFDIYGTLIDWESGIYNTVVATSIGPFLPSREQTLAAIDSYDTRIQSAHPDWQQSEINAEGLRRYAKDLRLVEDGKLTQDQVDKAAKQYGSAIGDYPAFDDTVAAIRSLGKRFKLVPLTNVDNKSWATTLSGSLKGCRFDAVYTAEDIGSYKPDLKNFHYLLDHLKADLGVEKEELVHVAQSLFHDHRPAKQMGLTSVWVDRKCAIGGETQGRPAEHGYVTSVETLGELAGIVEKAFGKA
jgi:2-haloalkanoic acid dehalogenase type II